MFLLSCYLQFTGTLQFILRPKLLFFFFARYLVHSGRDLLPIVTVITVYVEIDDFT